jgi:hypothetical protein
MMLVPGANSFDLTSAEGLRSGSDWSQSRTRSVEGKTIKRPGGEIFVGLLERTIF